jgi:hypothetical protein
MSHRASVNKETAATALKALGVVLMLLAFGCAGYHVGPVAKHSFTSIAVPMFRN